ncbi:MAG: BglII/BstYI family type II restriction endonuclease [Candidatus Poribacteria bacterium]|nr:BglII/BstYI family type II restriction endonuclease [Candidatus Poribacteria bacterium]
MIIAAEYSFNDGHCIQKTHPHLLKEVEDIIAGVDASHYKTKESKEITMPGKMLYSPPDLNSAFAAGFESKGWQKKRVTCTYSTDHYRPGYSPKQMPPAYREMDFLKGRLGVEVQFGKYAFMVYNVCAKMTIFRNLGHIDAGIEIVPVKSFASDMSTGVSYFEQFVWDLETRGVADIDIPVLIFGVDVGETDDGTSTLKEPDQMQLNFE